MKAISIMIRIMIVLMLPIGLGMLFINPLIGIGLMVFSFAVINLATK